MNLGLKEISIILGIVYGTLIPTGKFLDSRWNQQVQVKENAFCAASNKEMYLKVTLNQICQKYGYQAYPCPINNMSNIDQVNYRQYEEWLKMEQERIRRMFQKG